MNFTFVILHYMVYKDTIECVKSILENVESDTDHQYQIVVVDNGSTNNSISIMRDELKSDKVYFIKNDENMGFARGNNIGFRYAKEVLHSDYIALLNNDTLIKQTNWLFASEELYNTYHYAALGPDIITADGDHQNPFYPGDINVKGLRRTRKKQQFKLMLTILHLDALFRNSKPYKKQKYISEDALNVYLHGACLIFSKDYIEMFDGLCERTFLYMEEEILKLYLDANKLVSLYSPKIKIYHKEDVVTNAVAKNTREKSIAKYRYWIESSKVFEEIYIDLSRKEKVDV